MFALTKGSLYTREAHNVIANLTINYNVFITFKSVRRFY